MDLKDKVVVVTGASSGLGRAFSHALVERGAQVYGLARRVGKLQAVRREMAESFHPIVCDVTNEEAVRAAFDLILRETGRIDVLVNNAGLGKFGPVDAIAVTDWDVQMETNLRGVFLCTRAVLPPMKAQNRETGFGGHIINIASVAGLIGNASISAYNASKFGLRGFTEALMKEVREDGIKVTCLFPGSIETDFFTVAGVEVTSNPMQAVDVATTVVHVLETPDNYLVSEITMRPLRPKG